MTAETLVPPLRNKTVGEIAATLPGATAVFRKYRLDFCCSGDDTLDVAAAKRGVDVGAVEQTLAELYPQGDAWQVPEETPALIDHILSRYHEIHRRELPELVNLSRKVEAVHAEHEKAPIGLADVLQKMLGELEMHMKKEELILFPAMVHRPDADLAPPILQMRHDHDEHGAYLRQVEALTEGFALPDDACRSWQALYAGIRKFTDDLMEHIHLENNVLFPRFEDPKDE